MLFAVVLANIKPLFLGATSFDVAGWHGDLLWGIPSNIFTVREALDSLHPPLWMARQCLGSPHLAVYLSSMAYPSVPLAEWMDFAATALVTAFSGQLLTSFFAYLLFRRLGASAWGAAAAGALASLSGFYPWIAAIRPISHSVPWILCWVWSAIGLMEGNRFRDWAQNLAAGLLVLLAGDAQITVQSAYVIGPWFVIWALRSGHGARKLAACGAMLTLAALCAWMLASAQMVPSILFFSKAVNTRAPTYHEFSATFPPIKLSLLAGAGLFSRMFTNLFLPVSVLVLGAAAAVKHRSNPALQASLIVTASAAIIVLLGRSGLAHIPYNLPMLKPFVRHYKYAIILQGPLFFVLALGFDALAESLLERTRLWVLISLAALAVTLFLLPDHVWRLLVLASALALAASLLKGARRAALALLFLALVADAGSFSWQTPRSLRLPDPDPLYLEYVKRLGHGSRSQVMFNWTVLAGGKVNEPLPVHGTGYHGESGFASWMEFPLKNHAYLLHALSPEVADIQNGEFSRVDFVTAFKSTDFVDEHNRRLLDMIALKYFFMQDMALSAADRFPVASDPRLSVTLKPFEPFRKIICAPGACPASLAADRPSLRAEGFGSFCYKREFSKGDVLRTRALDRPPAGRQGQAPSFMATITASGEDSGARLLLARAGGPRENFSVELRPSLPPGPGEIDFGVAPVLSSAPASAPLGFFIEDPMIVNPGKDIRYLEGSRVMVFENTTALGRARIVHKARKAGNNREAMVAMRDPARFDPRAETLLMDGEAPEMDGPPPSSKETAVIDDCASDGLAVKARLESPGYLVLADTYYPGWRAFDSDGREHRIFRSDISLRALPLPAGEHEISFAYIPEQFRLGLFASIASFIALIFFASVRRLR